MDVFTSLVFLQCVAMTTESSTVSWTFHCDKPTQSEIEKKGFFWLMVPERVGNVGEAENREVKDGLFSCKQQVESGLEVGQGHRLPKPLPSDTSSSQAYPLEVP